MSQVLRIPIKLTVEKRHGFLKLVPIEVSVAQKTGVKASPD